LPYHGTSALQTCANSALLFYQKLSIAFEGGLALPGFYREEAVTLHELCYQSLIIKDKGFLFSVSWQLMTSSITF